MQQGSPSRTAFKAAVMRAAHQFLDSPPVFVDPLAVEILGPGAAEDIRADAAKHRDTVRTRLRAMVAARSRFVEEELARAVRRGARQYVVLGAGLDTFALRNPHAALGLRVYEVDHPDTQAWKLGKLAEAGLPLPETLALVPMDFERHALDRRLIEAGFRPGEPTFFSWLGVTMYLEHPAVLATLGLALGLNAPGGGIVFDYVTMPPAHDVGGGMVFRALAELAAREGEPWKGVFEPEALAADLLALGYGQVEDLGPERITELYYRGRDDGLMVGGFAHLFRALV